MLKLAIAIVKYHTMLPVIVFYRIARPFITFLGWASVLIFLFHLTVTGTEQDGVIMAKTGAGAYLCFQILALSDRFYNWLTD